MKKSGFTLVELVITITILVILSTIAFVSFQSYTQDSRDANRLSSLNEIQKGLTLSYSKNGSFPTPKNATTYTGGTISLLQGTLTQEILPELQSDPKDPLSKSSYTYSTTSDGEYFQIASDIENTDVLSQVSLQQTYAKVSSALVKGNYKFDPSLPSLIVIPTTSLTSSGIFSPDNCFVTNGGTNTIGNTTCATKKQAGLKNIDSNLVGYWDMETLTGTQLLDLSGNGNNGIFSGGMMASGSTILSNIGKGQFFNGTTDFLTIPHSETLNLTEKNDFSIFVSYSGATTLSGKNDLISKWTSGVQNSYPFVVRLINTGTVGYGALYSSGAIYQTTLNNKGYYFYDNYTQIVFVKKNNKLYFFVNGKIYDATDLGENLNIGNTSDISIGRRLGSLIAHYKGVIDEVKIYNRALSDKEIEQQAKILGF